MAPGVLIPDLYGRAACATEIRLRGETPLGVRDEQEPVGLAELLTTPPRPAAVRGESRTESRAYAVATDTNDWPDVDISDFAGAQNSDCATSDVWK